MPEQSKNAEEEARLAEGRAKLEKERADFAAQRAEQRKSDDAAFIDGQISVGKFPKGLRSIALEFMATLDATNAIEFSEGSGKVKRSPADQFRVVLSALPIPIGASVKIPGGDPEVGAMNFAAPQGHAIDNTNAEIYARAREYQRQNPKVDFIEAAKAVGAV